MKHGSLNDIGLYLDMDDNKKLFDELKGKEDFFQEKIGYKFVWDRNDKRKASRISCFSKFSYDMKCAKTDSMKYDFNLDVEKVATELIKFYKVFVPYFENRVQGKR